MSLRLNLQRVAEWSVLILLPLVILWKGGKTLESTWLLIGVAWLCAVGWWRQFVMVSSSKGDIVPPFLWCTVMLSILWVVLSYRYSLTQNYGLNEVFREAALGLLFFWVVREGLQTTNYKLQTRALQLIAASTLLACLIGVLVYVLQPVNRFVGTFFDFRFHTDYWPNSFAQFLLLAWPVLAYVSERLFARAFIRLFAVGFVIGCLFLTYSRGAVIVFLSQIILWFLLDLISKRPLSLSLRERVRVRGVLSHTFLVGLIALAIFFSVNALRGLTFEVQDIGSKVTFTASEGGSSASERREFWKQAYDLAWERPLLGFGPYSFRFIQPRLQEGVFRTSDHPHNVFLKLAMERGWIAAVLFGLTIGYVLLSALGVILRRAQDDSFLHISIVVSLFGALAHNLIDYDLQFVGIALPFTLLLGILASLSVSPEGGGGAPRLNRKFVRSFELILATFLIVIAIFEGRFIVLSSIGRHAEARGNTATAVAWYERAKGEWFSRDLYLSQTHMLLGLRRISEAHATLDRYFVQNAEDFRVWRLRGDVFREEGRYEDALEAYEKAVERGATYNDLGTIRGILESLVSAGEWKKIEEWKPKILSLLEEYVDATEENVHFIALGTNVEEFLAITDRLAKVYPKEAPRFQLLGARVDRHAREERARIAARPLGRLW